LAKQRCIYSWIRGRKEKGKKEKGKEERGKEGRERKGKEAGQGRTPN